MLENYIADEIATMDQLPHEIIEKIIFCTDVKTKSRLRQTCTTLFNLSDHNNFVIYFARSKMIPEMIKVFSRYQKPISITFTKTISLKPKAVNSLSKLTNLTGLSFDIAFDDKQIKREMMGLDRLTNLQHLTFGQPNNYFRFLKLLKRLTQLIMHSCHTSVLPRLGGLVTADLGNVAHLTSVGQIHSLSTLTHLRLTTNNEKSQYTLEILSQATNLKSLDLAYVYTKSTTPLRGSINYKAHPLPIGMLTNLERVRTVRNSVIGLENCRNLTSFSIMELKIDFSDYHDLKMNWALLTKLKRLELNSAKIGTDEHFYTFLSMLTLLDLTLTMLQQSFPSNIIKLLPTTITHLALAQESLNLPPDDMSQLTTFNFLRNLVNLTSLKIIQHSKEAIDTLTSVSTLTNLKTLSIELKVYIRSEFVSIDLSQLPYLESLTLPITTAETLKSLSSTTRLTFLDGGSLPVQEAQLPEILQNVVRLTCLKELALSTYLSLLPHTQEEFIKSLTALQQLTSCVEWRGNRCQMFHFLDAVAATESALQSVRI